MNILVTGGSGFIGTRLTTALIKEGHRVILLLREKSEFKQEGAEVLRFKDYNEIPNILGNIQLDGVIHLATLYIKDHKTNDILPLVESNVTFPTMVAQGLSTSGLKWWINASTCWEFNESLEVAPQNLYASTKSAFLNVLNFFQRQHGFKATSLVLGDSFGPGDPRRKIFTLWKNHLNKAEKMPMSGGEQKLNMLYVDDIVEGFLTLVDHIDAGQELEPFYTLRYPKIYNLKELCTISERILNQKINIDWGKLEYRKNEVFNPAVNFPLVPGWKGKIGLEEGIRRFFL